MMVPILGKSCIMGMESVEAEVEETKTRIVTIFLEALKNVKTRLC